MTKQDKAHTELPWTAELQAARPCDYYVAKDADGNHVCSFASLEDAAFIVTACNEHYETKALIAELVGVLEDIVENSPEDEGGIYCEQVALAALRKAGAG